MPESLFAGIDIGGTNTRLGLVDPSGRIHWRDTFATSDYPDAPSLIKHIHESLISGMRSLNGNYELSAIGVGAPNSSNSKGTVEHAANLSWKGVVRIKKMFQEISGVPVSLTNDAKAAAIGEMLYGHAKGMTNFVLITLGTGLGSGIIVNGEPVYGHDGFAGEIGHTLVIPHGRSCGCGRKGCLEQYCSASGIVKTYREILRSTGVVQGNFEDETISARQVFEKALSGDEAAFYAFNYTGEMLGYALANTVAYLAPESIFLLGGLANAGELLLNPTIISFEKNVLNVWKNKIKIRLSGLPENDAAILGAAALARKELINIK